MGHAPGKLIGLQNLLDAGFNSSVARRNPSVTVRTTGCGPARGVQLPGLP
jgi:hypothetical protein